MILTVTCPICGAPVSDYIGDRSGLPTYLCHGCETAFQVTLPSNGDVPHPESLPPRVGPSVLMGVLISLALAAFVTALAVLGGRR